MTAGMEVTTVQLTDVRDDLRVGYGNGYSVIRKITLLHDFVIIRWELLPGAYAASGTWRTEIYPISRLVRAFVEESR